MKYQFLALILFLSSLALSSPLAVEETEWLGSQRLAEESTVRTVVKNVSQETVPGVVVTVVVNGQALGQLSTPKRLAPGQSMALLGTFSSPPDLLGTEVAQVRLLARPANLADLEVDKVTAPNRLTAGQVGEVIVWVKNRGHNDAVGPTLTVSRAGKALDRVTQLETIGSGRSIGFPVNLVPEQEGVLVLTVRLDPEDRIAESNEWNNLHEVTFKVEPRAGSSVSLSGFEVTPSELRVDSAARFKVSYRNGGKALVARIPLVISSNGEPIAKKIVRERLKPGESGRAYISWVPKREGQHTLNVTLEGEEIPRYGAHVQVVQVAGRPAQDLEVVTIDLPEQVRVGRDYQASVEVTNSGDAPALGCKVRLVKGTAFTVGEASEGFDLGAGQSRKVGLTFPPLRSGQHTLKAVVFSSSLGTERDPDNNEFEKRVTAVSRR